MTPPRTGGYDGTVSGSVDARLPGEVIVLTPVFNDWPCLLRLMEDLAAVAAEHRLRIRLLVVDDGSTSDAPLDGIRAASAGLAGADMLRLRANVGHQRAIALGLCHLQQSCPALPVVSMDADGEDLPSNIPLLLRQHGAYPGQVIAASRKERHEGPVFRLFYWLFRMLFLLAAGRRLRFGNFFLLPAEHLKRVVSSPDTWNHVPASLLTSRCGIREVFLDRGRRYHGTSRMDLAALILHGLRAISVFCDIIFVRMLLVSVGLMTASCLTILVITVLRLCTDLAIPGWASTINVELISMCFLLVVVVISSALFTLNAKLSLPVLPWKAFPDFADRVERIRGT